MQLSRQGKPDVSISPRDESATLKLTGPRGTRVCPCHGRNTLFHSPNPLWVRSSCRNRLIPPALFACTDGCRNRRILHLSGRRQPRIRCGWLASAAGDTRNAHLMWPSRPRHTTTRASTSWPERTGCKCGRGGGTCRHTAVRQAPPSSCRGGTQLGPAWSKRLGPLDGARSRFWRVRSRGQPTKPGVGVLASLNRRCSMLDGGNRRWMVTSIWVGRLNRNYLLPTFRTSRSRCLVSFQSWLA